MRSEHTSPLRGPLCTPQMSSLQQRLADVGGSPLLGLQDAADTLAEELKVDMVR